MSVVFRDGSNFKLHWNAPPAHYIELFTKLFRLENALRLMVYAALKTHRLGEWQKTAVQRWHGGCKTIADLGLQQGDAYHYLIGWRSPSPMMYLKLGELMEIISDERNQTVFAPILRAPIFLDRGKIEEVVTMRNVLVHYLPIKEGDARRVIDNCKPLHEHVCKYLETLVHEEERPILTDLGRHTALKHKLTSAVTETAPLHIEVYRTSDWLRISLSQEISAADLDKKGDDNVEFWSLSPGKLWSRLSPASGPVVYFTSNGSISCERTGGNVGMEFVLAARDRVPDVMLRGFCDELAAVMGQLAEDLTCVKADPESHSTLLERRSVLLWEVDQLRKWSR